MRCEACQFREVVASTGFMVLAQVTRSRQQSGTTHCPGWLAIALVIFTIWRSNVGVFASILFGGLYILHMYIPTGSNPAVKELYKMLPYLVTIVVLCISSLRKKREDQPPQHLGLPYFREER